MYSPISSNFSYNNSMTSYREENFSNLPSSPMNPYQMASNYANFSAYDSPCIQNKSVSSGYASSSDNNSSYNNSPAFSNYFPTSSYLGSTSLYSNLPSYGANSSFNSLKPISVPVYEHESRKKCTKRERDDEIVESQTEKLINEIFKSSSSEPENKRAYKKAKKQDEIEITKPESSADNMFSLIDDGEMDDQDSLEMSLMSNGIDRKKRVLTKAQRKAANQRERKRMNIMNDSFVNLRAALPISTGRKRRKMSRLDIVIGAMEYIDYLNSLLDKEGPIEINFEAYQNSLYMYD